MLNFTHWGESIARLVLPVFAFCKKVWHSTEEIAMYIYVEHVHYLVIGGLDKGR